MEKRNAGNIQKYKHMYTEGVILSIKTANEAIDLVTAYAHIMINKTIGNDTNQQNACQ